MASPPLPSSPPLFVPSAASHPYPSSSSVIPNPHRRQHTTHIPTTQPAHLPPYLTHMIHEHLHRPTPLLHQWSDAYLLMALESMTDPIPIPTTSTLLSHSLAHPQTSPRLNMPTSEATCQLPTDAEESHSSSASCSSPSSTIEDAGPQFMDSASSVPSVLKKVPHLASCERCRQKKRRPIRPNKPTSTTDTKQITPSSLPPADSSAKSPPATSTPKSAFPYPIPTSPNPIETYPVLQFFPPSHQQPPTNLPTPSSPLPMFPQDPQLMASISSTPPSLDDSFLADIFGWGSSLRPALSEVHLPTIPSWDGL
ncbi:hypothetical protein BC829DRAFT_447820 [Chytridium lagenaria]|nr:hypothetical protein BC829DRAFT_447820 [Chytridium lagenaria]